MTITYEIKDNLYVNVTNQCSNACDFCVRNLKDAFQNNLWLEREPTLEEIIKDIFSRDLSKYKELVFCGFGEPLERLDTVLEVCKKVKEKTHMNIRINTNGQANKIHNYDVTPRFKSLIDSISVSLNARNAKEYDKICHSRFGEEAFDDLLDFTKKSKKYVEHVQLSVVDCLPPQHIQQCKKIADSIGVNLKIRKEIK
ncbi:TatD family nuclease-associated radical SAM protein [Clostridium arbusti]|uniref:TatD family nuclease-associated radical SAM protein n=1 Tax=Clostridium arbusti TaxID=1137848 RepID=UPI00028844B7|nr:TatD family nuclease-associated radical SAM protein [Clostridium arbusti]